MTILTHRWYCHCLRTYLGYCETTTNNEFETSVYYKRKLTLQDCRLCQSIKVTSYLPMVCIHTCPEALTCVHSSPSSSSPKLSEGKSILHHGCSTLCDCKACMVAVFLWDGLALVLPLLSFETSNVIRTGSVRKYIVHHDIFLVCTIHNWQSWDL